MLALNHDATHLFRSNECFYHISSFILYKSSTISPSSGIKTRSKIPATSARFLTISCVTLLWFTPSRLSLIHISEPTRPY